MGDFLFVFLIRGHRFTNIININKKLRMVLNKLLDLGGKFVLFESGGSKGLFSYFEKVYKAL